MEEVELEEIYGAPALIQFREGIARAAAGEMKEYMPVDCAMRPTYMPDPAIRGFRPVGARRQIAEAELETTGDHAGAPAFRLLVKGMVLPARGGRVIVAYEAAGGALVSAYMRPGDIVAVSIISERPDGGGIIQTP